MAEKEVTKPKKPKKTVADWDQMLFPLVDKANPPRATRHLDRQTMCGACMFKCCNSEIFTVELTPAEAEKFQLPLAWPQNGRCHCLTEQGCKFGDERPSFCKIYPVQIDFEKGHLYAPQWALLHCPTPKNFEFVGMTSEGKWEYKKKEGIKGPIKNNTQERIFLDFPIEQWPTIIDQNAEGLAELYSVEMVEDVKRQLKELRAQDEVERLKKEEKERLKAEGKEPAKSPELPPVGGFDFD